MKRQLRLDEKLLVQVMWKFDKFHLITRLVLTNISRVACVEGRSAP